MPLTRRARARLHVLFHLFAWSQAGTLLRLLLEAVFGNACEAAQRHDSAAAAAAAAAIAPAAPSNTLAPPPQPPPPPAPNPASWAPCVASTTGPLFLDIAPNAVGSFAMGLLAPSAVLHAGLRHRLSAPAPLALLNRASPLQAHAALLVGLRTGFCGSLTTFASWILQAVGMLAAGDWVGALCALALGVVVPVAALQVGQQVACALYARHNPSAFLAYEGPDGPPPAFSAFSAAARGGPEGGPGAGPGGGGAGSGRGGAGGGAAETDKAAAGQEAGGVGGAAAAAGLERRSAGGLPVRPVVVETAEGQEPPPQQQQQQPGQQQQEPEQPPPRKGLLRRRRSGGTRVVAGGAAAAAAAAAGAAARPRAPSAADSKAPPSPLASAPPPVVVREVVEDAPPSYTAEWLAADALAAAVMLSLTAIAAWQVALAATTPAGAGGGGGGASGGGGGNSGGSSGGAPRTNLFLPTYGWIAVLLSPTGSCARYYLSRLNGRGVPAAAVPRPVARWWLRRRRRRAADASSSARRRPEGAPPPSSNGDAAAAARKPPLDALSRPGGRLLQWFPWGTFAANVSACALDFACKAAEHLGSGPAAGAAAAAAAGGGRAPARLPLPPGGWAACLLHALVSGVGGTLSTVSTWVVELQRLMLGYPADSRGWAYMLWSVGASVALGVAVYGGAVWAGGGGGGGKGG